MHSIVIVGAGTVGRALGSNLLRLGHRVRYAVRDMASAEVPDGAEVCPVGAAATSADLVLLAVPFGVVQQVVARLGLAPGQILIDATNPFGVGTGDSPSGAAMVAAMAGDEVIVVKAFNVLGAEHMTSPPLPDGYRPVLPVASDDPAARRQVLELATAMGFDAIDVGALSAASLMEDAARYWGLLAFVGGRGRQIVLVAHQRP